MANIRGGRVRYSGKTHILRNQKKAPDVYGVGIQEKGLCGADVWIEVRNLQSERIGEYKTICKWCKARFLNGEGYPVCNKSKEIR